MLPGDAHLTAPPTLATQRNTPLRADLDRPRKPRSNGGPEGPWWRRPIRP